MRALWLIAFYAAVLLVGWMIIRWADRYETQQDEKNRENLATQASNSYLTQLQSVISFQAAYQGIFGSTGAPAPATSNTGGSNG